MHCPPPPPFFFPRNKNMQIKNIMCIFFQFLPHISISMSLKSFSIYIVKFFELYISTVLLPNVLQLLLLLFCRNKKNTLVEPFFNCLFTFTMECGAYSNNAMSSRSSFTKQQIFLHEPLLNLYQKGKKINCEALF